MRLQDADAKKILEEVIKNTPFGVSKNSTVDAKYSGDISLADLEGILDEWKGIRGPVAAVDHLRDPKLSSVNFTYTHNGVEGEINVGYNRHSEEYSVIVTLGEDTFGALGLYHDHRS